RETLDHSQVAYGQPGHAAAHQHWVILHSLFSPGVVWWKVSDRPGCFLLLLSNACSRLADVTPGTATTLVAAYFVRLSTFIKSAAGLGLSAHVGSCLPDAICGRADLCIGALFVSGDFHLFVRAESGQKPFGCFARRPQLWFRRIHGESVGERRNDH